MGHVHERRAARRVPADQLAARLSGWELDRKLSALRALSTQTSGLIAMLGAEVYASQVAEESFVDALTYVPGATASLASVG